MAVITDIGDANTIHPLNKIDVGLRLALAARKVAYNEQVFASGPVYDGMKVEGHNIRLTFKAVGSGLIVDSARHIGQKNFPVLVLLAVMVSLSGPGP